MPDNKKNNSLRTHKYLLSKLDQFSLFKDLNVETMTKF